MDRGDWIAGFLAREALPATYADVIREHVQPLATQVADAAGGRATPLVLGICGAQGSGKSTLTGALAAALGARGLRVAPLSIDDLYLGREERARLARTVHPLLATRGVPGTHDVPLGLATFDALAGRDPVALPSFDKSRDDRRPREQWPIAPAPVDVIVLEGWCVGAAPQEDAALATPVNALERDEDPDGAWRRYVNDALRGAYRALFGRIDLLVLLRAPSFEVVHGWRSEQEEKLRRRLLERGESADRLMDAAGIARFIAHYERLTRHILAEMPERADVLFALDASRRMTRLR